MSAAKEEVDAEQVSFQHKELHIGEKHVGHA